MSPELPQRKRGRAAGISRPPQMGETPACFRNQSHPHSPWQREGRDCRTAPPQKPNPRRALQPRNPRRMELWKPHPMWARTRRRKTFLRSVATPTSVRRPLQKYRGLIPQCLRHHHRLHRHPWLSDAPHYASWRREQAHCPKRQQGGWETQSRMRHRGLEKHMGRSPPHQSLHQVLTRPPILSFHSLPKTHHSSTFLSASPPCLLLRLSFPSLRQAAFCYNLRMEPSR
mmetsp:Transcript_25848/g.51476  ORF Transcript_25848/g.51476 Transcript_25848/m.51476 type:complete len:228 (-) Transcript_25848:86-769(-)